ncbi:MAG: Gfo/Idh/MocA family oxidoreductase [Candidatus Latescibacterota bacterium]
MGDRLTAAVIGCGRMGQHYATVYRTLPDTELVAIAERHPERRRLVGERFGVKALYADAQDLFAHVVPDVAAVVLPGRYIKDAVIAAAQAGVRGVSADKPIAACLADADQMVDVCRQRGVVFGGGNLQRAMSEVQEAARWLQAGDFGPLQGACVHRWSGEISGGGCQHVSVLRLFAGAEVTEVTAWARPQEVLEGDCDAGLNVNGLFRMSNGMSVPVFGEETPYRGVDAWTADALVRWDWNPPEVYQGLDAQGRRRRLQRPFTPYPWSRFCYLGTSIRSFLDAVRTGSPLWISGHDLRQALEVAVAAKHSALWGSVPVALPLADRSLALCPSPGRWLGADPAGHGQALEDALRPWEGYREDVP